MGQSVATVRSLKDSNVELKERLMFVESVANRHLDAKLGTLFQEGDEEGGFTLEIHKRVNVQIGEDDESVYSALDGVISANILHRVASILQGAVRGVLQSCAVETVKYRVLTVWENNVLMRLHFYLWRYLFSSEAIFGGISSVIAFAVVKRTQKWEALAPGKAKKIIGRADVNPILVALTMKTLRVRQPDWMVKWVNPTPKRRHYKRKKQRRRRKRCKGMK